jgi:transposase
MPYKSTKIKIMNGAYDKRIKLTVAQKNEIISLKGTISQRKCAEMFNVSRRTIQFLWDPEKLKRNIQRRQERGGTKQYYNKEKHREQMKTHRRYKQQLYLEGKITNDED